MFDTVQSYEPALDLLSQVDADVITFETKSTEAKDLPAIGRIIKDKKIGIGVIDHHVLQVESPAEVAALIRVALEHVPAERLIVCTDCGMGREGMTRRHALYKMVSLVRGTNLVRRELDLPEAACLAADPRYSLVSS
jgi:5-methyltetrahydropteroyltriglutamate--homocysteine methyltransferase